MSDLKTDLAELIKISDEATPGEWSIPHFSRQNIDCDCPYIFSDEQYGVGSIVTIDFGGENEPYERARANGLFIPKLVNFFREHQVELKRLLLEQDDLPPTLKCAIEVRSKI